MLLRHVALSEAAEITIHHLARILQFIGALNIVRQHRRRGALKDRSQCALHIDNAQLLSTHS